MRFWGSSEVFIVSRIASTQISAVIFSLNNSQLENMFNKENALVSFAVGLAGLVIVALATGSFLPSGSIKEVPWWGWIGGLLGAFFMTVSAYSVRNLGTTFFFAVIIASQLAMALLIDHYGLFGQIKNEITVIRAIGFSMLIAGTLLIKI